MTTHTFVPRPVARPAAEVGNSRARLMATARRLLRDGLLLLGLALVLGIAETFELWLGALFVAVVLLVLAALVSLVVAVGLAGRTGDRFHR